MVTLATMNVFQGITMLYTKAKNIIGLPQGFNYVGQGYLMGKIPVAVVILIICTIVTHIVLTKTVFGRYVFAIGGNADAAKLSGIYLCEIDESTEKMSILDSFGESVNPSFIKQTEDGKYLVAVNEKFPPSKLDVYRIDGNRLHLSDSTGLSGIACCYAIPSKDNSFIAAVHYGDGEAFTYELLPNGKIGNKTFSHTNCGSGPVSDRQEGPHAHSIRYIPGVDVYAVCDLGCDRIDFYDYKIGGYCSTAPINGIATPAGAGPRHIEFSDDGLHIYVSCELSNEVLFYSCTSSRAGRYYRRENSVQRPLWL